MRERLGMAFFFTAVFSVINYLFSGRDIVVAIAAAPVFFLVMFVSMQLTNRITRAVVGRLRPAPEPTPQLEPSSERPDHARRRRSRGRRRGRGRRL